MKIALPFLLLSMIFLLVTCSISQQPKQIEKPNNTLSYLALGDSYTIGESVLATERWPVLLAKKLTSKGFPTNPPTIIAQTGWRTDDLLNAMSKQLSSEEQYDLVSVLIGVNNQFQGQSIQTYEQELKQVLEQAIQHCRNSKLGVFAVSIPDYGATPYGASRAKEIGKAIDEWNLVFEKVCQSYNIPWYNITPISRQGIMQPTLVADDGLHPSGQMYNLWVEHFGEKVLGLEAFK